MWRLGRFWPMRSLLLHNPQAGAGGHTERELLAALKLGGDDWNELAVFDVAPQGAEAVRDLIHWRQSLILGTLAGVEAMRDLDAA